MEKQPQIFKKKELVLAISVAMFSGAMTGCSSSDDTPPPAGIYSIKATGGDANNSSASTNGGNGGNGGDLSVGLTGGTGGVKVLSTGKANTNFSSPVPNITANTGSNPLVVTASTSVEVAELWADPVDDLAAVSYGGTYIGTDGVLRTDNNDGIAQYATDLEVDDARLYSDGSELYEAHAAAGADLAAAGTHYLHETTNFNGNHDIYTSDGSSATADAAHTGISVASGATLTLGLNYYGYKAIVTTADDISNSGTITTADNGTNRGSLDLRSYNYIASGVIDTSGTTTAPNGGSVDLASAHATVNSGAINTNGSVDGAGYGGHGGQANLYSAGFIKNSGAINSSGTDATAAPGGYGAEIAMYAAYVENSGDLNASGGNGSTGFDGNGANKISLGADFGVNNSGNLTATGGDGDNGGSAGQVNLYTWSVGTIRNSGSIATSSGTGSVGNAGDVNPVFCCGGDAVSIQASGGDVINSGDISTAGGSGVTGNNSGYGGYGGYAGGGDISFDTYPGDGATARGDIIVSGNLDTSGGDISGAAGPGYGGYSGDAGSIFVGDNGYGGYGGGPTTQVSDQMISLLGYTDIDTSGGNGNYAGSGGDVDLYAGAAMDEASLDYKTGPVVNEADISTRGGDAIVVDGVTTYAQGNRGGNVYIETAHTGARLNQGTKTSNSGAIDTSGGNSYNVTSYWDRTSGYVNLFGYHGASNSGVITANGGNDTATDGGTDGYGSYAQSVNIGAETGAAVNTAAISNNGGNGEYRGGYSNGVDMYGTTVNNSGDLSSNGGNADVTLANSTGGYGGHSYLWGTSGFNAVSNSGALSYSGGTGDTDGSEGSIYVGITCEGDCTP